MRVFVWLVALALVSPAFAAKIQVSRDYLGWGGPGEQVFRSKLSIVRNNPNNERAILVIADDLKPRGGRLGIVRVVVTYEGGRNATATVLKAIHAKPYTYPMIKMYDALLSPRIARVVLPCPEGVRATFRFYNTIHPPVDRSKDKGLVDEYTVTLDASRILELPIVNPSRDPRVRKPRKGEEVAASAQEPQPEEAAPEGETPVADPERVSANAADVAIATPPPVDQSEVASDAEGGGLSRDEQAMARARQLASQLKSSERFGAGALEVDGNAVKRTRQVDEDAEDEIVPLPRKPQEPLVPTGMGRELEDTPEMIRAQQKAMERLRRMGLQK